MNLIEHDRETFISLSNDIFLQIIIILIIKEVLINVQGLCPFLLHYSSDPRVIDNRSKLAYLVERTSVPTGTCLAVYTALC